MHKEMMNDVHRNMNVVDVIYRILKKDSLKMHYKELIQKAFEIEDHIATDSEIHKQAASILTDINTDGRFSYFGNGVWGLDDPMKRIRNEKNKVLGAKSRRLDKSTIFEDDDEEEDLASSFIIHGDEDEMDDHPQEYIR